MASRRRTKLTDLSPADVVAQAQVAGIAVKLPTASGPSEPAVERWTRRRREAWQVPAPLSPSEWAERHIELSHSVRPGRYRNVNAPYGRLIMDIVVRPGVSEVNVRKAAQVGVSQFARNLLAYWADRERAPAAWTMPSRDKARQISKRELLPLFKETPVLRDLLGSTTGAALIETITLLNGFNLDLLWSGSATSTASNSYCLVINDECDKFDPWAGDEPDPIARTKKRLRTFGDRGRQVNISTPTVPDGAISKLVKNSSVVLFYHVPCPHCGHYQRLVWPNLRWVKPDELDGDVLTGLADADGEIPREKLADALMRLGGAVWYECEQCHGRIEKRHRFAMLNAGRWSAAAGFVTDADGVRHVDAADVKRWPRGSRIAFDGLSALYCLWTDWETVVAEFLLAEGDLGRTVSFYNETLGEPFARRLSRQESGVFAEKSERAALDEGIVPAWAWLLLCTIDTQLNHFYVVVRAWGAGMKSQRVWHGRLVSFDEIDRLLFGRTFEVERRGEEPPMPPMPISLTLIDSGGTAVAELPQSRTMAVYEFVAPRQHAVRAIKGSSRPLVGLYARMTNPLSGIAAPGRLDPSRIQAFLVDSHKCNDVLADFIAARPRADTEGRDSPGPGEKWLLNRRNDAEYNRHMASMQKVPERIGRRFVERWQPIHAGDRVDYRMCEAYQIAAAYMAYVHTLVAESDEQVIARKRQLLAAAPRRTPGPASPDRAGTTTPDGRPFLVSER